LSFCHSSSVSTSLDGSPWSGKQDKRDKIREEGAHWITVAN
jgi:hypothetical protein